MSAHASFHDFRERAIRATADPRLQVALDRSTLNSRVARQRVIDELPDAEAQRDHLKLIRAATLANLVEYLEQFERNAIAAGAHVHWARDAAEATRIVTDIATQHGATMAVKSKSMASEEIHLNDALRDAGVEPVETDLGEWIVQLAGEPPAHIIGPALHKTRDQIAELFSKEVGRQLDPDDIPTMTAEARRLLRQKFLDAGIGISGANLGIAETGTVVLVTNEGNGRMVTSLPPVHVAVMGIEKVCPTWDHAAAWLELLARSSTGQPLSVYTTAVTGPAQPDDPDGPQEVHIVLLDNGRSEIASTNYVEILQCIRCGACLNACPVYQEIGGHTYGHTYSGPIGAVLVPLLFGLEKHAALPHASSLCGACLEVCPSRIDLPRMLLDLRAEVAEKKYVSGPERTLETGIARLLTHQHLFGFLTSMGRVFQRPLVRGRQLWVPRRINPAGERQLPSLAPRSFHALWADLEHEGANGEPPASEAERPRRWKRLRTIVIGVVAGVTISLWRAKKVGEGDDDES